jgi:DNA-binding LacI/PurR family transcriptional regulator
LDKKTSFYWVLYQMLAKRLLSDNLYGVLEVLSAEDEAAMTIPHILREDKAEGLVVVGQLNSPYYGLIKSFQSLPVVFLDSCVADSGSISVISDGYYGMYAVTSHLIEMGHSKIHFVGTVGVTSSIADRYFGYCRAMSERGLGVGPEMVIPDRGPDGVIDVSLPDELPTAYACNCDLTAAAVAAELRERGLGVPGDVSIAGFDDYLPSGNDVAESGAELRLTTYAVDMDGLADSCVAELTKTLRGTAAPPRVLVVGGRLVVGDTVRRL